LGAPVNTCKQCQKRWSGGALAVGYIEEDFGYILGVAGYDTPIWDVLVLQGEQEEAGEHLHGAKFENYVPIRQVVPVGLAWARFCSWARCGWFFTEKKVYYSSYHIFTYNVLFYKLLGRQERVDGIGWVWMSLSQLGRYSQLGLLGLGFAPGLAGLSS